MIRSQIRNLGGKAIVKNNKSHQETFDELSQTPGVDRQYLAQELSKIPSNGKQKSTASLRYTFIACLIFLAALRVLAIVMLQAEVAFSLRFLGFIIIVALVVPVVGIYAALFHKIQYYQATGILLAFSLFQSIRRGELVMEVESLLVLVPFAGAVFLVFFIPSKMKTPFKKTVSEKYEDGKLVKKIDYVFEDTRVNESGLLDSKF